MTDNKWVRLVTKEGMDPVRAADLTVGRLYKVEHEDICGDVHVNDDVGDDSYLDKENYSFVDVPAHGRFEKLGAQIGRLTDEKNAAYGSSVDTSVEAMKLLYPDGIKPEQYADVLLQARIWDKQMRIANRKDAFGENPYNDIAGYGLLGAGRGK